jgi:hypothetical protein
MILRASSNRVGLASGLSDSEGLFMAEPKAQSVRNR